MVARDGASSQFDRAGRSATGMEGAVSKLGKAMVVAGAAVTTAAVAIGYESVKAAVSFQASMTKIQTQAGASAKDVKTLSAAVLNMKDVQQGPQQLADSLFHLKSVGLSNVQAMKALRTASDLAAVGGANLEDTTNALAGAWRSGIKGAQDFTQTASTLNAIVGAGNMRMGDLVEAMGTGFLPSARSFGLSLKSVGAALALMTDEGIPANVAATRLRMTFSLLGAPTAKAAAQLQSIGLSSTALATAMRGPQGIVGAVGMLKSHLDASGLSLTAQAQLLSRAFGGGRSSSAILTLLNNYTVLEKKQKQINDTLGKYGPAVAAQRKTASAQLAILTSTLDTLAIKIGSVLLPFLVDLAKAANTVLLPALGKVTTAFLSIIPVDAIEKDWNRLLALLGVGPKPVHVPVVPVLPPGGPRDLFGTAKPSPVPVVPYLPAAARSLFGNTAKPVPVAVVPFLPGGGAPKSLFAAKPVRVPVVPYVAGGGPRNLFGTGKPVPVRVAPVPAVPFMPGGAGKSLFGTAKPVPVPVAPFLPGGAPKSLFTGMPVPIAVIPFMPSGGPQFSSATLFGKAAPKAATSLASSIGAALSKIDWGKIISTAITAAVSMAQQIGAAVLTLLGKVNWAQVGKAAAFAMVPFAIGLVNNLLGALISEAVHHPLDMLTFILSLIPIGRAAGIIAKLFGEIKVLGPLVKMFAVPLEKAGGLVETALGKMLKFAFGGIAKRISGFFKGAGGWLLSKGDDIVLGLLSGVEKRFPRLANYVAGIGGRVIRLIGAAGAWLLTKGTDVIAGLLRGIENRWPEAVGWLRGVPGRVISLFARAGSWLLSAGGNVIRGLLSGIIGAMKGIGGWIVSHVVDPVINAVKGFFGIHSPSTVMAGIGSHLVAGLMKGMATHDGASIARKVFGSLPSALGAIVKKGLVKLAELPGRALKALGGLGGDILSFLGIGGGGGPGGTSSGSNVSLGRALAAGWGWTGAQFDALNKLWTRESGWSSTAENKSSGAYGIPQSLPGSKMASAGGDWRTNPATQIRWGLGYIAGRYGSPIGAWAHETSAGWYAKGTTGAKPGWAWVGERGKELVHFTGGETVLDATSSMRVTRGYAAGTPEIGLPPRKGTAWADAIAAGLNKIPQVLLSASIWKDLHKLISTLVARQKDKKTSDDAPPWLLRYTQKADLSLGRLGKAAQKLAATISAAKSYASGTTSTLTSFGDISGMDRTGLVTGSGIQSYLAGQAGIIGQFSANLKKLHAAGVSRTVIGQIIALGPADGNTVAAAILAAPGQITGINKAAASVAKLATAGGQTAADLMYDSGKQAGKGFLSGLEGQQKAIAAAMRRIARSLVNELRKELKIKSPSMVTHEIGTFAAMGLELGALSRLAHVQSAASLLASAAVPHVPAGTYAAGGGAAGAGTVVLQPQFDVRVFVGNQEITDIARTEIRAHDRQLIRMAKSGTGNAG